MARRKGGQEAPSSGEAVSIPESSRQGRVTRSRSRANAAEGHIEPCSLPDTLPPRKKCRGGATAAAASPSSNAKGSEEGSTSKNTDDDAGTIPDTLLHEAHAIAPISMLADEQPYGHSEEEAGSDGDDGVIEVEDDHGDHSDENKAICDDNSSNNCGDENNVEVSLICCAAPQEPSTMARATSPDVAKAMSATTALVEESQPNASHTSLTGAAFSPGRLQEHSKDSTNHSRRKRGPTRALDVLLLPKGQKLKVMHNELGQAVGDNANKLSSFMGTIARNGSISPLTFKDWRMMPQTYKDKMWNCILEKFEVDKCMRRWIMMSLSTKWKNWKSNLKKEHYDNHETDEQRLADCNERVLADQWADLVRFWSSEEGTKLCKRNKANRSKQTCIHTTGTKSFARIREEEKARTADGTEPSRVEFFIKTHQKKSGELVDDRASKIIAEFNKLLSELPEESQDKTTKDHIFSQVMGRDQYGRVRTYGLGPIPSDFCGSNSSRAESAREAARSAVRAAIAEQKVSDLQKQMEEIWQENQQLRQEKEKAKQGGEKSALERQLEEMWQENLQLLLGNDKMKEAQQKISNLQRQMDELLQENQQLRQENEKIKQQIKKMKDILTNAQ